MNKGVSLVDIVQIVSALAASIAAIVAAYTAYQSREATKTVQKDTERRRRPRIGMYLVPSPKSNSIANLVINNHGGSVALHVKFNIKTDVDIQTGSTQKISEYLVFKNGLKAIYPDQTKEQRFMYLFGRDEAFFTRPIEVEVTYKSDTMSTQDEPYREVAYLDFLTLPEISSPQKDLGDVTKELEKMRKELEQIRKKKR